MVGFPLDPGVRKVLEASFAHDLSGVRVHVGGRAGRWCAAIGADACARGSDLFFREHSYEPSSEMGLWLLAHEAAHVVQYRRGDARTVAEEEDEANAAADAVLKGRRPVWRPPGRRRHGHQESVVRLHSSWEHRLLGDLLPKDHMRPITQSDMLIRLEILRKQRDLMLLFCRNPEQVTEQQIVRMCPWIKVIRLPRTGILMTYGELNTLSDYLSNPETIDKASPEVIYALLQTVREESFVQLNKFFTRPDFGGQDFAQFERSMFATNWAHDALNPVVTVLRQQFMSKKQNAMAPTEWNNVILCRNACHFAPYSWYRWVNYHQQAIALATEARQASGEDKETLTRRALLNAGYADHFAQDSFAAGHLIDKTLIMQWFVASKQATDALARIGNWDRVRTMTYDNQKNLCGTRLYGPYDKDKHSHDPQTVDEEEGIDEPAGIQARINRFGISPDKKISPYIEDCYTYFLHFLNNRTVQFVSKLAHDRFNEVSVTVSSPAQPTPYVVWGDDTMVTNGQGMYYANEAAYLAREAVYNTLAGSGTVTPIEEIFQRFPTHVQHPASKAMLTLADWHTQVVKPLCENDIFEREGVVKRIMAELGDLGTPTRDYPLVRKLRQTNRRNLRADRTVGVLKTMFDTPV